MTTYYHTKDSVNEYIQMAEGYSGAELIEILKKYLVRETTVLEIGSGPGTDYQILSKDYQVTGSDFSEEFLRHLQSAIPSGSFIKIDASQFQTDNTFDAIYSNKVLQHLNDEQLSSSIKSQLSALNKNGVVCHSFWKGSGSENFKGMLVNYQNSSSLKGLFGNHFEILHLEEYKEFEDNDSILIIARKR